MDPRVNGTADDHTSAIGLHHVMELADQVDEAMAPVGVAPPVPPAAPVAEAPRLPDLPDAPALAPAPADDTDLDDDDGSIEAIRRRLAARGLLVQGPAIVVPKELRPDRAEPAERALVFDDVLAETEGDLHPNAVVEDDWDVASEGGPLVPVRCPQCRGTQQTPVDVTRFRCVTCQRAWRWAICGGCDEVGFTIERQESWRCKCGHFSRSWWRTDVAARDAHLVVARRRDLALQAERELVRIGMRKRRWKIVAGGIAGLLALLVFVGVVRANERVPAAGTDETCRLFKVLKSDLGSGALSAEELDVRLDALNQAAGVAEPAVRDAAGKLQSAGGPTKVGFLVAQTELSDACDAVRARR